MKFGPVHVIRDSTFQYLQAMQDVQVRLSAALAAGREGLARKVWEQTHGLFHSPLGARVVPGVLPESVAEPSSDDLAAAERIVAAYTLTQRDNAEPPSPGMWERIASEKQDYLTALANGDVPFVARALTRMFTSELTWGLGQVHSSHPELLASAEPTHLHYRFTDTVVNLAEALGAARVTDAQKGMEEHLAPLDRDLDLLYQSIVRRLGFDLAFPNVGSRYGFRLDQQVVTLDTLTHALTTVRLRQLGVTANSPVYEIGGGYGCLAMMAHRSGLRDYTIFDLPWVNSLQGYLLIRTLPAGSVSLYGEPDAPFQIRPYWDLDRRAPKSCECLINTDSLPEMGRATAVAYLPKIARVVRRLFLSINQECKSHVPNYGEQNCVAELVEEGGLFRTLGRQRYWMRQGYVEELYEPLA